jgi:hypothetical protein
MNHWNKYISLYLITFALLMCIDGMALNQKIDNQDVEKLAKELDFEKTKTERVWKKSDKTKARSENRNRASYSFFDGAFKLGGMIAVALLLGAMLYFIGKEIRNTNRLNVNKNNDQIEIENIQHINLEDQLANSIRSGDYREALRWRFLILLKEMEKHGMIVWKPYKTNREYAKEMGGNLLQKDFRMISGVFEKIWYAQRDVQKDQFLYLDQIINKIQNELP